MFYSDFSARERTKSSASRLKEARARAGSSFSARITCLVDRHKAQLEFPYAQKKKSFQDGKKMTIQVGPKAKVVSVDRTKTGFLVTRKRSAFLAMIFRFLVYNTLPDVWFLKFFRKFQRNI